MLIVRDEDIANREWLRCALDTIIPPVDPLHEEPQIDKIPTAAYADG